MEHNWYCAFLSGRESQGLNFFKSLKEKSVLHDFRNFRHEKIVIHKDSPFSQTT